jgi:ABC-2 type transport system ATP-binding protein
MARARASTLIKMLATLLPPSSETARIAGFDLVEHPEAVRRKIGYVSQMLSADGDMTGYENLLISDCPRVRAFSVFSAPYVLKLFF